MRIAFRFFLSFFLPLVRYDSDKYDDRYRVRSARDVVNE